MSFTGKNIQMIWGQAFIGCRALTKVEIPSITTLTGVNIFNGCSALTNLTLPKTLITVARMAFNNNYFQHVMFEGKTLAARYIPSNTSESGCEIHIYEGSSYPDAYDLNVNWLNYENGEWIPTSTIMDGLLPVG